MPYASAAALPPEVKKLPAAAARIWRSAFNAHHAAHPDDEAACFRIAWGAVKNAGFAQDASGKWSKRRGANR